MTKKKFNYDDAVKEIETILQRIEKGEENIDKLSEMVNRATDLIKQCRAQLRATEVNINKSLDDVDI